MRRIELSPEKIIGIGLCLLGVGILGVNQSKDIETIVNISAEIIKNLSLAVAFTGIGISLTGSYIKSKLS